MAVTIAQLRQTHPYYESTHGEWAKYREAYNGGVEFRNSNNIRRFYTDEEDSYENILGLVPTSNICKQLITSRVNQVFVNDPHRYLTYASGAAILDQDNTPGLHSFMRDCTFDGQSFSDFMEEVTTQAAVYGHCWVFVDKPSEDQIINDDPNFVRPYLQILLPQQVLDWSYSYVDGRQVLSYIKFLAQSDAYQSVYVTATIGFGTEPTKLQTYIVMEHEEHEDDDPVQLNSEIILPEGMGIPCVKVFAKKDPSTATFGISDIKDAVYTQRFLANLDREAYESIIYKKSILKLPIEVQTPEGGGMGIVRGDIDELDAVDFAVPDTADIDSVRMYGEEVMKRFSALNGMTAQTGAAARSGESFYQERQELYKIAAAKTRYLEVAEHQIFELFGHWQLLLFAGTIEYDCQYSERDNEMRLYNLKMAREMAPESPVVNQIIERELVKIIGTDNDRVELGMDIQDHHKPIITDKQNLPLEEPMVHKAEDMVGESGPAVSVRYNGTYDPTNETRGSYSRSGFIVKP